MPLFLSWEDTRRMLDRTVVSYEGRLSYVTEVTRENIAKMTDAETGERFTVEADFHKVGNPKDGRLGYIAVQGGNALYVVRSSSRVYKIGYAYDNLLSIRGDGANRIDPHTFGAMLEGLHAAYVNEYPGFAAAYAQARETGKLVAYDRSFAVGSTGKVYYQSHHVGQAHGDDEAAITWTQRGLLASFTRQRPQLNWR